MRFTRSSLLVKGDDRHPAQICASIGLMPITLLLADDANSIRSTIRHILETEPAIELIDEEVVFNLD
jgi:hypothetical protein